MSVEDDGSGWWQTEGAERSCFVHVLGILRNISSSPSGALSLVYYDDLERAKGRDGVVVNLAHVLESPDSLDVSALVMRVHLWWWW